MKEKIVTYYPEELIDSAEFDALTREYAKCNAMPNTDAVKNFDLKQYLMWGRNCLIGVLYNDDKMVGLCAVLKEVHLHTNACIGVLDSLFVLPEYRNHNNGASLMNWAKTVSRDFEASVLLVTAPAGSRLEKVYTRKYKRLESWFSVEI